MNFLVPRFYAALVLAMASFSIGFALWAQHFLQLIPCPLCYVERWPYYAAMVTAALALALPARRVRAFLLVLCAIAFVVAFGLAFVHLGVEFHWWKSPLPACNGVDFTGMSIAERLAAMPASPSKSCEDADYPIAFLPVSFVQLGLMYAVFCTVVTGTLLRKASKT